MMSTADVLALIREPEGTRLECKEARQSYDFGKLAKYASALANEGGGVILLGVTDRRPRSVVGTAAFMEPGKTEAGLFERTRHRVSITEHTIDGHRVLAIDVPARRQGLPVGFEGSFWMRTGEALVGMTPEVLQDVYRETESDFTAEAIASSRLEDLSTDAIEQFRGRWMARAGSSRFASASSEHLLRDAGLIEQDGGVTGAALLLLGSPEGVSRHLPSAELVFEYRSSEAAGPAQERVEFRQGFLLTSDALWELVNKRNDRQSIQEGFFRHDIPTFDEKTIREGILNAFAHRDYRDGSSIFVIQRPRRLEIISPGGFPAGVTAENILTQQRPRNRCLAEALGRVGLIERAGQGVNLMYEQALRQGKQLPSFAGSTAHEVRLVIHGTVANPALIAVLEKIGEETLATFSTEDFLVLDYLQRGTVVPATLHGRLSPLVELGVVERIGRGRGVRYLLSRRVAAAIGQSGTYTRRRGLDHATNLALILKHLSENNTTGSSLSELHQVLPTLSYSQVKRLLRQLRTAGQARVEGTRRYARWFHVET
jgi:ATP-dependent DNA helicase RecG